MSARHRLLKVRSWRRGRSCAHRLKGREPCSPSLSRKNTVLYVAAALGHTLRLAIVVPKRLKSIVTPLLSLLKQDQVTHSDAPWWRFSRAAWPQPIRGYRPASDAH